ncbi:ead/Ea22-like family protein [Modicisalibacter sp. MOD 31.J]|uniref:ead/Ea22-like family protein n=1 Tax=Modicisalibacter sp. MOD 31.J TaxID=2831897 RepID=UPI001CCC8EEB|nr:ead/Ea22-like family protein [Modicisalibacter sp. MOD 31.J]MBZ9574486.1 hypothetical protein [Modicisalibacter sp. MOD 31.J]
MQIAIQALRDLASKASRGPRVFHGDGEIYLENADGRYTVLLPEPSAIIGECGYDDMASKEAMTANHRLFAALDPDTVIGLLDRLQEAERELEETTLYAERLRRAALEVCNDWIDLGLPRSTVAVQRAFLESTGDRSPAGKPIDWLAGAALSMPARPHLKLKAETSARDSGGDSC